MSDGAFVRAAASTSLGSEASLAVEIDGQKLLLCRSKGLLFAVANRCSHADEPLACGRVRGGWIACPVHGARFDLATGRAMNPPASAPIQTFPVREADGWIAVRVPAA